MEISHFAPVCIPTLCRYEHFKRCVESLSHCTHAEKTDLFIALDMPMKDSHKEGYMKICQFISLIKGFKNVFIVKRDVNYGAVKNSYDIILTVFRNYDRLIFSEDDNEFSPNFLEFVNKGLDRYEGNADVYAICGYHFPYSIKNYENNIYSSNATSAWGIGYWRGKYISVSTQVFNFSYINSILASWNLATKLYYKNYSIINDFISQKTKNILCEDCLVTGFLLFNNKYCIFPTISKVRNWGQDGSGEHSGNMGGKEIIYTNQQIDEEYNFTYDDILIKENEKVHTMIKRTYHRPFIVRLIILIRFIFYMFFKWDILKWYFYAKMKR